ncbi:MAG: MBL fold metallo-hydrolase, partial [Gammaproteobacteria bacterium]|nr:MBL fold metallo-hydrolase [Gammaproteobacteria bacterium]
EQGRRFGGLDAQAFTPSRWLAQGDTVAVGDELLEVLHTPGHTPGHVAFFHRRDRIAFVGDVLFAGSIGRTDLPRSDFAALLESITGRLWPLGDDVTFVPGHGPTSTFGEQRRSNPFVGDAVLAR